MLIRETGPDGWLRVSIGTAEEMRAFRAALHDVIGHDSSGHDSSEHDWQRHQYIERNRA